MCGEPEAGEMNGGGAILQAAGAQQPAVAPRPSSVLADLSCRRLQIFRHVLDGSGLRLDFLELPGRRTKLLRRGDAFHDLPESQAFVGRAAEQLDQALDVSLSSTYFDWHDSSPCDEGRSGLQARESRRGCVRCQSDWCEFFYA